jgi:hypothetical protein
MLLPLHAIAAPTSMNDCEELLKLAKDRFLCLYGSSDGANQIASVYEHGTYKSASAALYETINHKTYYITKDSIALPLQSQSYLNTDDPKIIMFFRDFEGDHAYFCKRGESVTEKHSDGHEYVTHMRDSSCTPVPDGHYQSKSPLAYEIIDGRLLSSREEAKVNIVCYHGWENGHEALDCEDRN